MKKKYKLTIQPLTVVHVGTGKLISPLDYKLCNVSSSKGVFTRYVRYSSDSILNRIAIDSEKMKEFEEISKTEDIRAYYDFFNNNCNIKEDKEYLCAITDEFKRRYYANQEKNPLQNGAEVYEQFKDSGAPNPVIPGSSLKGSIRTAVLNYMISKLNDNDFEKLSQDFFSLKNPKDKAKFEKDLQKNVLGILPKTDFAKLDPFRALEIADCIFEPKGTQIVGLIKNISEDKKNGGLKTNPMQIQAEAIKGLLIESDVVADTILRINVDLQDIENGVSKALKIKEIIDSCNDYYMNEFEEEYKKFYLKDDVSSDLIVKLGKCLKQFIQEPNTFVIRVGRWVQCESVTFEDFRSPKTSKGKDGVFRTFGKTRSVFNYDGQYLPMGWCRCKIEEIIR